MSQTSFAHPEWLGLCVSVTAAIALALAWASWAAARRSRRLLGRLVPRQKRTLTSDVALLVALAAIGLALLGPRLGERIDLVPTAGVDVVFLVDVSRSMDAKDVPPSRLARARRTIAELLGRLQPGDRAALAAFAGRGLLLTPLTPDRGALGELLAGIDSGSIRPADSNLGDGIRAALAAFEAASERPRVLVVASDGEDPRHRDDLAIAEAVRADARVVTAALGSDAGSPVPDDGRPLRDRSGVQVSSRRDAERLARLATATAGRAFAGDEWGRIDFDAATAEIRREVGPGDEWVKRRVAAVRVAPFAALAFVLLLLEGLPRPAGCAGRVAALAVGSMATLPFFVAGWPPVPAQAADHQRAALLAAEKRVREEPENARAHIALGLIQLEQGRSQSAERAFLAAAVHARDTEVEAVADYDVGVAALEHGDLETAREAFFDALSLDPSDSAARFNLEWTLATMRSRRSIPAPQSGESSGEKAPASPSPPQQRGMRPSPTAGPTGAAHPDSLSAKQRRRWLERAHDDTRRWLKSLAGAADASRRSPEEAVW